jgi:hypothetical protein
LSRPALRAGVVVVVVLIRPTTIIPTKRGARANYSIDVWLHQRFWTRDETRRCIDKSATSVTRPDGPARRGLSFHFPPRTPPLLKKEVNIRAAMHRNMHCTPCERQFRCARAGAHDHVSVTWRACRSAAAICSHCMYGVYIYIYI